MSLLSPLLSCLASSSLALAASQETSPLPVPPATTAPRAPDTAHFSSEQLQEMVAPIALYPDSLLAQVLMAATYPIEVIEAARFVQSHPRLSQEQLEVELRDKDWEPSVKSLCAFPTVLERMNEDLEWMRDLGDAFLAQQTELMETVQRLRREAYASGRLATTPEQTVVETPEQVVVIEPASPDVVYVPVYDPLYVWSGWARPWWFYPTFFAPVPFGRPRFFFGVGVPWGFGLWGRCNWDRFAPRVDVDVRVHNAFVARTSAVPQRHLIQATAPTTTWSHDPAHRRGANYRDPTVARRFEAQSRQPRFDRDELRGRARTTPSEPRSTTRARPDERTTQPDERTTRPSERTTRPPEARPEPPPTRAAPPHRDAQRERDASDRGHRSLQQPRSSSSPRSSAPHSSPSHAAPSRPPHE